MKTITIGRGSGNDAVINDIMVSLNHCQIIQDSNGNYNLIDYNSTNGTYINGKLQRGETRLNPSDIIRIGNTILPWQTYFSSGLKTAVGETAIDRVGYDSPRPAQSKPDSFLAWSIVCTILCCWPFGIPAIVNAAKVDRLWFNGDYAGSIRAAENARMWFWWSFGVGLFAETIVLIYYIIIGAAIFGGLL